jgi:hypothetical protein
MKPFHSSSALAAIVGCLMLPTGSAKGEPPAAAWRYVVPEPGQPMENPPLVSISLAETKPEIVKSEPKYRGKPLYGLLRYGSPNSPQVTVVLDDAVGTDFDLYVDGQRSGHIDGEQKVAGEGRVRRAAAIADVSLQSQPAEQYPRQIVLRRGITGRTIGVATIGYLEGSVQVAGKSIACRRVDGDANGLYADLRDRLWLDLNADGQWDAFSEQFPMSPAMVLFGKRYAVRSDQGGTRLALEEITGEGTIKLELATLAPGAKIKTIEVSLMGDDGSAYAVRADAEAIKVPEGGYAVRAVQLSLEQPGDARPWNFQFTRNELPTAEQWQRVKKDEEIKLDPIGPLVLAAESPQLDQPVTAGTDITIRPRLSTAGGLWITSCDFNDKPVESWDRGKENCAETTLCQTDGTRVTSHSSGFA